MTNMTEAPISFTTKVNGDLLTIRGDNVDDFANRLIEVATHDRIVDAITDLQSIAGHAPAVVAVKDAMPGTTVGQAAVAAPAAPTVETDKYGAAYTYNHPEAPALPDGRGSYILKEWTDRSGKARKAFVDPVKGPRPFPAGAAEAPIQWL